MFCQHFSDIVDVKECRPNSDSEFTSLIPLELLPKKLVDKPFWVVVGKRKSEHFDLTDAVPVTPPTVRVRESSDADLPERSVFGSPLRLEAIADLSLHDDCRISSSTPREILKRPDYPPAISLKTAKQILNEFCKKSYENESDSFNMVVIFTYDVEKPKQAIFQGVFKGLNSASKKEVVSFSVYFNDSKPVKLLKLDAAELKLNTEVVSECQMMASYNIHNADLDMGWVRMEANWLDVDGRLQLSSNVHKTQFLLKFSLHSGNVHSPVYSNYCELQKVLSLLNDKQISDSSTANKTDIQEFLQNLKDMVFPPVSMQPYQALCVSHVLDLSGRNSLDFTDYLWLVLSQCTDLDSLTAALRLTFSALQRLEVNASVHKDNNTNIAKLVRQSHAGMAVFPKLLNSTSVEFALEIGVHKIYKDLQALFIDNRLCSVGQWESFFKSPDREVDMDDLQSTVSALVKLNYILEVVALIDAFTEGQNLFEITKKLLALCKNGEMKEGQVLTYAITATEAMGEIKRGSLAMMSRESTLKGNPTVDCFMSKISPSLGFLSDFENSKDISLNDSQQHTYHHFTTKARSFLL